jgi:glycosyltransferase involved in cell wall biosynthesis
MPDLALRLAHLTTVDMSLALLLETELAVDVAAGHSVFGLSAPGPYVEGIERLGVTHVPVPSLTRAWAPRKDLAAVRELAVTLRGLDLDVLHTHNPKTGVLGRVLGRMLRIPVVVNTCHGLWVSPQDHRVKRAAVLGAEALAAAFSHAELYQNDLDRATLSRWVPARKSRTVGNGIDLDRFEPDVVSRQAIRQELGVGADEILVGGVGRRVAEKGIHEFVAAARALGDRARFVWVGPDDNDKHDALTTPQAGVDFLGLRHDMPAIYAALDIFVLPSYREGFSRSAMEAAASCCALVLSDIRGCREIGAHEEEVLLTPAGDAEGLTAAVARLLDDAGLRQRLAKSARERALATFDQRAIARTSLETYRELAARKGLLDSHAARRSPRVDRGQES